MESDRREQFVQAFPILALLQGSEDPPLDREAIEELELVLGVHLPADYIDFLLAFNGGYFRPDVRFDLASANFIDGAMITGFSGEPGDGANGLGAHSKLFRDRLPEGHLAIADGPGQDLLTLKFDSPRDFAGVWYWDSTAFWISEDRQSMFWVADTFHDFLRVLEPDLEEFDSLTETIPIFQTIERNNSHTVHEFLAKGGSIETRNERGLTLLAAAANHGYPRIVKLLLEHSADPNARDHEGKTPLHHAAQISLDCVKLLLAAGSDITARDNDGHGVIGNWYYRADKFLRDHGAVE
ncbi:MAG TPA: ankyrin repeat domain-containing protein [Pirellulales bacterium]|jgi:hypothetical protein